MLLGARLTANTTSSKQQNAISAEHFVHGVQVEGDVLSVLLLPNMILDAGHD